MAFVEARTCPDMQCGCVAVIWPRFGPYHVARLEVASRTLAENGWRVVGVEIARTDDTYAWNVTGGAESFDRFALFPKSNYHTLTPRQIASAVSDTLDRTSPSAVATVGWSFPEARAALNWCRTNARAAICMSDSKHDDIPRTWWKEWMKRQVVKQFDAALVAGKPHVEYASSMGIPRERIVQGVDVVDNNYFASAAERVRQQPDRWRAELDLPERFFLSCGRFIPKKNLGRLLEAYALYRKTGSQDHWGLVMVGGGPLEVDLRRRADDLALNDARWPGFVQIDDLPKYYALASAFLLPSASEQWGLVVNEAMASGLPVLVSRTAGCRYDLVEEAGNGYLFDPQSVEDMAEAMSRMAGLPDPERRSMAKRSEEIISRWDLDRFAEGLREALSAARTPPYRKSWWSNPVGRILTVPVFLTRAA